MNLVRIARRSLAGLCVAAGLAGFAAGCDDNDEFDHKPPAGMGSLILDNRTADTVNVIVDGASLGRTDSYDDRAFDLVPGMHRVLLDQHRGDRSGIFDFNVASGRLTVLRLEVSSDWNSDHYRASFDVQ